MKSFGWKSKEGSRVRHTRGTGVFEGHLARLRARQANRLIPDDLRQGRILDVGCGSMPYFLAHTSFKEKFAIDQLSPNVVNPDILWHTFFEDEFFSVVTMLAVVEHLNPSSLVTLFAEVHRILQPGGVIINDPRSLGRRTAEYYGAFESGQ